jgi:nucleotide-binding universal stress UspA family protein
MQTLRHVVAGTDFSVDANHAVALAVDLALAASAPLTLVHVCELGDDDDAHRLLECERALSRAVDEARSRGAGRALQTELGSVAGHLVRSAERPVLTVPNDSDT